MSVREEMIQITKTEDVNVSKNTTIFQASLAIVKEKISVVDIRASTIHLIIKYVIEELDETPLQGTEKKEVALHLIREIVVDLTDGEDEKKLLAMLDDGTISNLIDLIIDATKGKINVNAIASVGVGCVSTCLPYCFPSLKKKLK
jgi:hypothetical protein